MLLHNKMFTLTMKFIPLSTGSNPPLKLLILQSRQVGTTARKGPIGSTNHQWWMKKTPH